MTMVASAPAASRNRGNDFTAKNAIARQLGGKRMFLLTIPIRMRRLHRPEVHLRRPNSDADSNPDAHANPTPTATPTPGQAPPATFGHNTLADFSASGEPFIRVDKQDNVYVSSPFGFSTTVSLLWKSTDHGRTFIPMGTPIARDAVTGPGGGDTPWTSTIRTVCTTRISAAW